MYFYGIIIPYYVTGSTPNVSRFTICVLRIDRPKTPPDNNAYDVTIPNPNNAVFRTLT
jgi:hypothetical protein